MSLLLVGGVLIALLVMVAGVIATRNYSRRQEWGPSLPSKGTRLVDDSWARAAVCIAIGAVVPIVAIVFTWLASQGPRFHSIVWVAPVVITLNCAATASRLARKLFDSSRGATPPGHEVADAPKPTVDDDAFDVVSSRG
jgi:hypothetical protein